MTDTVRHPVSAALPAPAPAPRVRLCAERLTLGYGERTVVHELDLSVPDGSVTAIIGPNGCGKSTLLRAFGRLMKPRGGRVLLDGSPLHTLPTRTVAGLVGLLPQNPAAPEGLSVADLVARGRHPHQSWYRRWSAHDEAVVEQALRATGTWELAERTLDELSGGQRQRAWIAMALAQDTELLLLDEPTNHLDLAHQIEVLDLVRELHQETGRTVVLVLHDLSLAARYADRLVAMKDGRVAASGAPAEVLTEELLADVFGLRARVRTDEETGTPLVVPLSRHDRPAAAAGDGAAGPLGGKSAGSPRR
ncbi:ABC transporter ATP-binding protein [Streptomyces sp. TRM 70351]|uniref:ABC transporter ATP-binding protein n=1 Tax=Streptomyces sp. TRM 70351 TaxID=3116552 RepID=UPI002E7C4D92|nr:ABC transporter ATP-binding protein [Streptomyces sp. TRM 70351]MEE1930507.1 ABC transporter ATP-binding protein [Streptomyces sp. TRM 70351]